MKVMTIPARKPCEKESHTHTNRNTRRQMGYRGYAAA
jgi:hypothetical protein